ncbi:MAG: hypothetical protein WA188_19010 [Terriglobales bacterium]
MIVWLTFGVALFAALVSAQTAHNPANSGAAPLVLPRPGIPASLEQTEERSRQLEDGTATVEVVKSEVYRDSAGRVRVQSDIRGSGHSPTPYIDLVDPVAGSRIILLSTEKIAYRVPLPKSTEDRFAFLGIGGVAESSHKWSAKTENAGKRTIEGIEYEGTRIIQTAEGEPGLTSAVEHWYSDELKLIGFVMASGPHGTYTARIQHLRREEPDPTLFAIPPGYKILDVPLPSPGRQ